MITAILAKKLRSDKAGTRKGEGLVLPELCRCFMMRKYSRRAHRGKNIKKMKEREKRRKVGGSRKR